MKKNGCKVHFYCDFVGEQSQCRHYSDGVNNCNNYDPIMDTCINKTAQREIINPKPRWTSKPAKREGFYKLKSKDGGMQIGQALDLDMEDWSTTEHGYIIGWNELLKLGYKRSVKPIEKD